MKTEDDLLGYIKYLQDKLYFIGWAFVDYEKWCNNKKNNEKESNNIRL